MEKNGRNTLKTVEVNKINKLIKKYNTNLYAMYGEYPHKNFWSLDFKDRDYKIALENLFSNNKNVPLLLYVHIPFCMQQCFYCTCRTIITKDYEKVKRYLDLLYHEIDLYRDFFDRHSITPNFQEIHLGGGSPTILREKEFDRLIEKLQSIVTIKNLSEFAMEIDPRRVDKEKMKYYHEKGISRISFGVQDFDINVQKAVNRIQPLELVENLLSQDVRRYFYSVNFDIICGLPRQTMESFKKTIKSVIKLSPDRISLLYLISAPEFSKHQYLMKKSQIPDIYQRTMFFLEACQMLLDGGYVNIGLDHFAKPTDIVAKAFKNKTMFWSGLGYTPGRYHNIIGIGTSSACRITDYYYAHNVYSVPEYEASLKERKFPIYRGYKLSNEDIIRRDIIHQLRSYFFVNYNGIEDKYGINFKEHFKAENAAMEEFVKDGILELSNDRITITEIGKQFTGLICSTFDSYLKKEGAKIPEILSCDLKRD